jgi:glutathione S-transferase
MRVLYHLPLDAACRETRIHVAEKGLECELRAEKIWERREDFLKLNPAGEVPVLVDEDHAVIPGTRVISEYLEEAYPEPSLLGRKAVDRAEVRRLVEWFALKFHREVTRNLVDEKIMKRFLKMGQPDTDAIRAGHQNVKYHLDYVSWLSERRRWLAGDSFSLADVAAAAQLSAVDYLGDAAALARRRLLLPRRRGRRRPAFCRGLPGGRALGGLRRGQGLVCAPQIAAQRQAPAGRSDPRRAAA